MENVHEEWRDVKGYEDRYQVSDLGRVRSLFHHTQRKTPLILRPKICRGYPYVTLVCGSRRRYIPVHSLVAEAFIGSRPEGMQVDHVDGNRLNNIAANLEYVTPSENTKRSYHRQHKRLRLSADQIPAIRSMLASGATMQRVADAYGVSRSAIQKVKERTTWSHVA